MSSDFIQCANCGHINRSNARFCRKCGIDFSPIPHLHAAIVPASEYCPECGQEVTPGVRYCRHCGARLTWPASYIAQPQPAGLQPFAPGQPTTPNNSSDPATHPRPRRIFPAWGWFGLGMLLGLLLGAGIILALPEYVGLQRISEDDTFSFLPFISDPPVENTGIDTEPAVIISPTIAAPALDTATPITPGIATP